MAAQEATRLPSSNTDSNTDSDSTNSNSDYSAVKTTKQKKKKKKKKNNKTLAVRIQQQEETKGALSSTSGEQNDNAEKKTDNISLLPKQTKQTTKSFHKKKNNKSNNYNNYKKSNNYKNYNNYKTSNKRKNKKNNKNDNTPEGKWRILNYKIVNCQDATELFKLLQQVPGALTKKASGGSLNTINFSTAIHRLAKHSLQQYYQNHNQNNNYQNNNRQPQQQQQQDARSTILADPRFALLVASLAEAMALKDQTMSDDDDSLWDEHLISSVSNMGSREFSNIAWALTKLKLVPPKSALPLCQTKQEAVQLLTTTAQEIRQQVLQVAKARRENNNAATAGIWIPSLSKLAGILVDFIRLQILEDEHEPRFSFQQQEISNLLWAWATANRAEEDTFGYMIQLLIDQQEGIERKPQEWSNTIWATATAQMYRGHDELLDYVARLLHEDEQFASNFKTQELSNTLWGVATLLANKNSNGGEKSKDSDSEADVCLVSTLTEREERAALQIARKIAEQFIERAEYFKPQEVSNTLWSLGTLGFGSVPSSDQGFRNNYLVIQSDDLPGDAALKDEIIDAVCRVATAREGYLRRFKGQELNNLAWGLARLLEESTPQVDELLRLIGFQLGDRRKRVSAQDVGTTLWAMGTLNFADPQVYRSVAARLIDGSVDISRSKPQELSNSVWAMATSEIQIQDKEMDAFDTTMIGEKGRPRVTDPVTAVFELAAEELIYRPQYFKSQEIKDTLWSFSKMGIRHPDLFRSVAAHLVGDEESGIPARGLADFSPQGIGNMAWAFARQAQLCEEVASRSRASSLRTTNGNGRLAVYTTSYFDIGEGLLKRLFAAMAEHGIQNHGKLAMLKPQDMSNTAWSFAVLGLRHDGFLEAAIQQFRSRINSYVAGSINSMTVFKMQEMSNLLWSLATLNAPVGDLLDQVSLYLGKSLKADKGLPTATQMSKQFKRQELANIAWSCAVFGYYPHDLMRYLYSGLLGTGQDHDPKRLSELYGDGGLQEQEVMTLIYVQLALEQHGATADGLVLPRDFPGDWQFGNNGASLAHATTEPTFELSLSTSKIQRAVSAAFHRIGFDHVEEQILTSLDMLEDHGLNLPPLPLEVLSIDIANVDAKIAIEVDGPAHFICHIDDGPGDIGFAKIIRGKLEYQFRWDGRQQRLNGPTALKHRLLTSLGFSCISIPFWEFYELDGDPIAEENYCRRLLDMR